MHAVPGDSAHLDTESTASDLHAADLEVARAALGGAPAARARLAGRLDCVRPFAHTLNRRHGRPLGEHACADLAQDAAATAWRRLESYAGHSKLETWVYRIVTYEFMNAVRKKQRRKERTEADLSDTNGLVMESQTNDPDPDRFEAVHAGLARLEPEAQTVIDLKHYEELTFEAIGERMQLSPSAVKRLYYKALKALKTSLEGDTR